MKRLIFIVLILLIQPGISNSASVVRCGPGIINIGDTKQEVLDQCGPPTFKEITGDKTTGYYREKSRETGRTESYDSSGAETAYQQKHSGTYGSYVEDSQVVETWYYNCGRNSINFVLTFTGPSLTEIETTSYGSGESDCIGAEARKRKEDHRNKERLEKEERKRDENTEREENIEEEAYYNELISGGNIIITGYPAGAKVYLDGYHLADLPCTLYEIEDGPHYLEVKKAGYEDYAELINITAGEDLKIPVVLKKE